MQKVKKGNAVLAIGLTAALALGSAGLASTAYANTSDQNSNDNAKTFPIFWKYCYNVQIYNDDEFATEKTYTVKVAWGNSIEDAVNASLEGNVPEGTELTGSMNWDIPGVDFDGAKANWKNEGATIVVHVKNTVVPVQEISLNVVDEQGNAIGTITVGIDDGILEALTNEFADTYDSYTWSSDGKVVDEDIVAMVGMDGQTIVAHKAEAPVVIKHQVTFDDCLDSTADPIIPVADGALIDPSNIPNDPVCDGYTFEGWYTLDENKNYSENPFDFKNTTIDSDLTLYAKWTENSADQGEENPVVPGEDTENGNQDTTNVSGTTNNDASDDATAEEASELPQTSDSTIPFAAGAVVVAGAAAVTGATAWRKRNSAK